MVCATFHPIESCAQLILAATATQPWRSPSTTAGLHWPERQCMQGAATATATHQRTRDSHSCVQSATLWPNWRHLKHLTLLMSSSFLGSFLGGAATSLLTPLRFPLPFGNRLGALASLSQCHCLPAYQNKCVTQPNKSYQKASHAPLCHRKGCGTTHEPASLASHVDSPRAYQ